MAIFPCTVQNVLITYYFVHNSLYLLILYPNFVVLSSLFSLVPTLSNPMDCSLPGSSVHGIFQARVLEWGAIGGFRMGNTCIPVADSF